ncbi:histidine kinase [Actinosynnema sp. NPDC047251]|uniref:histidine kinase n=1 Tax=Saccharothrix espanaensis TaxID=103731 RepID=UPI00031570F0|nr:histidine kinase [Saccharothrix espanaensis]
MLVWLVAAVPVVWAAITSLPGRLAPWEAVAYLVVLAAVVPAARRWPVGALLAAGVTWQVSFFAAVSVDSTVAVGALSAGLASVAFLAGRHATTGERGVVALVVLGAGAVTVAVVVGGADTALAALSGTAALAAVPWTIGRYRRQYLAMVEAGWQRAEQLERDVDRARARERARLAAEMHDLVGHELARAALRTGALELAPDLGVEHRASARAAREAVTAAAERLADVVSLLRTGEPERVESLDEVLDRARLAGLVVESTGDGLGAVDPVIAHTVHRVVTEAITNAIKHAPGAPVTVDLTRTGNNPTRSGGDPTQADGDLDRAGGDLGRGGGADGGGVELSVVSGPGRRGPAAGGGRGLLGLAERVALVGGTFAARDLGGAGERGGFEVRASLPASPVLHDAPATGTHRRRAELQVRRSARRTVLLTCAVAGGIVLAALGYLVFDATTSVLDPADYQRLRVGQAESEVAAVLPARTRVDDPGRAPLPPAGATCHYYSTHRNPFDARRLDLYRLCFRDGRLADKALLARDP